MGKVEEGYRELLLNTMKSWSETSQIGTSSLHNNLDAENNFLEKVNMLATFLYPKIVDMDEVKFYNTITGQDDLETGYYRMMYLVSVASESDLITPYEVYDVADTPVLDMEQAE